MKRYITFRTPFVFSKTANLGSCSFHTSRYVNAEPLSKQPSQTKMAEEQSFKRFWKTARVDKKDGKFNITHFSFQMKKLKKLKK